MTTETDRTEPDETPEKKAERVSWATYFLSKANAGRKKIGSDLFYADPTVEDMQKYKLQKDAGLDPSPVTSKFSFKKAVVNTTVSCALLPIAAPILGIRALMAAVSHTPSTPEKPEEAVSDETPQRTARRTGSQVGPQGGVA